MAKGGKRFFKSAKEYWQKEGYSKEESESLAKEWFGYTSKSNKNYYLKRGITESLEEAERLAKEYINSNCKLKKENMIKSFDSEEDYNEWKKELAKKTIANPKNNFQSKEYWIDKGYSEEEAKEKISSHSKKISKRRKEYWIDKGYSEEEAKEKISEFQDKCSLESFKKRYGDCEGKIKYEAHIQLMKEASSFKDSNIQRKNNNKTKHSSKYWIDKGYSEKEAKKISLVYLKKINHFYKEYWIDKGYSEKEAIKKAKKTIKDVSSKGLYAQLKSKDKKSKLEILVGEELIKHYDLKIDCKISKYFPDFFIKNLDCYLEVFGDYWHKNPEIYQEEYDRWNYDKNRIKEIKKITGKKVIVIWEKEIKDFGIKNIKGLVERKVNEGN